MGRSALRIAWGEVVQHPLRTVLISLGMALAVGNSLAPAAVIGGSRRQALERAAELGTDRIEISVDRSQGDDAIPREADLESLWAALPDEVFRTALRVRRARFVGLDGGLDEGLGEGTVWLLGADSGLPDARTLSMVSGRFLEPADARVPATEPQPVVLEARLAESLGSAAAAVGTVLHLERGESRSAARLLREPTPATRALHVVGVITDNTGRKADRFGNKKGGAFADDIARLARMFGLVAPETPWLDSGLGIYLPRSEVAGDRIDALFLRGDPLRLEEISRRAEDALVARGRAPLVFTNTLAAILTRPELDGYLALHDVLFWVLLLIGLAVLASLLLLSGWRRRREIALRRTEGATRFDIFRQFVWEGIFVAIVGQLLGIVLGMAVSWLRVVIDPSVAMAVEWPWGTILKTAVILTAGGLLASAYPAWRASGHHPMSLFRRSMVSG